MKTLTLLIPFVLAPFAVFAAGHDGVSADDADVLGMALAGEGRAAACALNAEPARGGVMLRAYAGPGLSGDYRLTAEIVQNGGSASISQAGPFEASETPALLTEIAAGAGAGWRARLTLDTQQGRFVCATSG